MNDTIYIYALKEKGSSQIRYIGQSHDPDMRFWQHLYDMDNLSELNPKKTWLAVARRNKKEIEMIIIEKCSSLEAHKREDYWIEYYESKGHALTNTTMSTLRVRKAPVPTLRVKEEVMFRTTIWMAEDQNKRIKELAHQEGVTPSELIRRAIDIYLILHGLFGSEKFRRLSEMIGNL